MNEKRPFLPLGSIVILNGSVKKLLIVSRGSIVEDKFFDYGAFLYPEGMIDTNIAYFNHDDIMRVVFEGYRDADDELVLEILDNAYVQFQKSQSEPSVPVAAVPAASAAPVASSVSDDLFANVRDLGDDDE
ncbi:DUF4176 domain-containing protein [Leucobacter insecticola]|uniref:DUF4176 domain-containing protein n=2 Tax=Leucobacter insecticola TaxID=2714934 RepID=A0A6G8FLK6_9MICO|nr:DUF4176 domain-containing protein [Leucobacter insecticola]